MSDDRLRRLEKEVTLLRKLVHASSASRTAEQLIAEAERLSAADGEQRLVVFEGFMLFYDPLLVHLFDRQIWLELTYEVAHARRMATTPMPQSHYDNALWPNYCSYKDISVFGTSKVHTIDGTLPPEGVLAEAIAMLGLDAAFGAVPHDRLNVDGGAIALGHPVGTSGNRIVLHLAHAMQRHDARRGIATECIGGGQGGAMMLEAA